ncbi:prefoldin subunit alpha [Candidatus Micrarchaeota archaeon]|nr:prefoldin subunit alpha [Candidatus Micrarchaeota archaeon]
MNLQDEYQRLAYEVAVYREQLNLLQREMDRVTLATLDLSNAMRTTSKLSDGDSLVPIGGGAFLKSEITNTRVLVPIGGGYLVSMDKDKAEQEIRKRVEATEKAIQRLNDEFSKISQKLQETNVKLGEVQGQVEINKKVDENIREDYI